MITYKILETSVPHFKNIEVPFDFSQTKVGDSVFFLGYQLFVTQLGTGIVCMSSADYAFTLQTLDVPEQETINIP